MLVGGASTAGRCVVQKALYPEGDAVCHSIIVHPPGGIAGGDALELEVRLREGAAALLTTPGAGKWYKSMGPKASLAQRFDIGRGAVLEWLPQPAIVFDAARAETRTEVRLHAGGLVPGLGHDLHRTHALRASASTRANCASAPRCGSSGRRLWSEYAPPRRRRSDARVEGGTGGLHA